MPYSLSDQLSLPTNVQSMSPTRRRQWVHIFNSAIERGESESTAFRMANGGVKELEDEICTCASCVAVTDTIAAESSVQEEVVIADTKSLFDKARDFFTGLRGEKATELSYNSFGLKEVGGRLRYFGVVSNNFRDRERQYFSQKDHEAFVQYVEETGNYPELWYWHIPDLKLGQADWIDYHDHFLVTSGLIDEGKEDLARQLAGEDVAMSHGYLARFKEYISDGYVSFEQSFLPRAAVANVWTDFALGGKDVTFTATKRAKLAEKGFSEDDIKQFESSVDALRARAQEAGIDFKDLADDPPATETSAATTEPSATVVGLTAEDVTKIVDERLGGLRAQIVADVKEVVAPLGEKVEAASKDFDEKFAAAWQNKAGALPQGFAATSSETNVVSGEKAVKPNEYSWLLGEDDSFLGKLMPAGGNGGAN